MERRHHLDFKRYLDTREGRRSPGSLALAVHRHAVECCRVCQQEWELVAGEQPAVLQRLETAGPLPVEEELAPRVPFSPERRYLPEADTFAARPIERLEAAKRHRRRKAQQELSELRRLPAEERPGLLHRAYKRFRSRALAELLIEESRRRVRTEPAEAESMASLVPGVLVRFLGEERPPWATLLALSAAAHRANAVRIGGDLGGAERQFRAIRREMAIHDVRDPHLIAEVANLEASLALGQRRFGDAEERLGVALLTGRRAGDRELVLRILLQSVHLQWLLGNPESALRRCDQAEALLEPERHPYLRLSFATLRTAALCDLERFAAAEEALLHHQELFEEEEDLHTGATLCALRGRIALGLGRLEDAASAFAMARDDLLAAGRHYDAALACLDLAETHLRRGDTRGLKKLAARLVPSFKAHGVERETLAVLGLLGQAVAVDRLSGDLLRELRQRLESQQRGPLPPAA